MVQARRPAADNGAVEQAVESGLIEAQRTAWALQPAAESQRALETFSIALAG